MLAVIGLVTSETVIVSMAARIFSATISAFVALQLGFQRGGALATAGVATLFTNALPIAAGVALFHEALPGGALGVTRSLAFAGVVAGAALLARQEGDAAPHPRSALPEAAISNNGA